MCVIHKRVDTLDHDPSLKRSYVPARSARTVPAPDTTLFHTVGSFGRKIIEDT